MRVYKSGHGARVLLMLAMTVLAVAAIFYGLGAHEGWGRDTTSRNHSRAKRYRHSWTLTLTVRR